MSVVLYSGRDQTNVTTLVLPEPGAFNASILKHPCRDGYVCVYRADERTFAACDLAPDLGVVRATYTRLRLPRCVDPRLVVHDDRVWLFFSVPADDVTYECIHAAELKCSAAGYECAPAVRITAPSLGRQKSWMPFRAGDALYIISHVNPHTVWRIDGLGNGTGPALVKIAEEPWRPPAPWNEELRGNAPPLRIGADRFVGTFHMSPLRDGVACYENGCYLFDAVPPFHVRSCSVGAYLASGDARASHLRRRGEINGTFPLALLRDGDEVLVSYGDNDSAVRVVRAAVAALLADMQPVGGSEPGAGGR